jgi:hypothetical protein
MQKGIPPKQAPVQKPAVDPQQAQQQPQGAQPQIEVVFVLDTTGSMSGLLEGAKRLGATGVSLKDEAEVPRLAEG